jgi:cytochrome d ubiquinol oxidase subunit II
MLKTEDRLAGRVRAIASRVYWLVCMAVLGISAASFSIQGHLGASFEAHPVFWVFPLVGVAGLFGIRMCLSARTDLWAFLCSCVFIVGLLCSAAFGLYPNVLPSTGDPTLSLTINNVAAPPYGLRIGFAWWIPAFLLACAYSFLVYRHFRGKVVVA